MTFQVGDRVRISSSVSEIDSSEGAIFGIDFFDDDLIYGVILDRGDDPSRLYWILEEDMVLADDADKIQISTLEGLV